MSDRRGLACLLTVTAVPLFGLALAGCVTYHAAIQKEVRRGDLEMKIEEASGHRERSARLTMLVRNVRPDVRLVQATVSSHALALCDGVRGERIGRDPSRSPDDPLVAGERMTIEFGPSAPQVLATRGVHLDLLLKTRDEEFRCVRVFMTRNGEPLAWEAGERFTFGFGLSLEGFTSSLGPVQQIVTFPVEFGVWIGRVHLDVASGIAGAGCPDTRCYAPDEKQRINYANSLPILAGARLPLYENKAWSVGAGLHYRALYLAADTFTGRESFWAHGAVFAPYAGLVPDITKDGTGMGGAREALLALEVPIGYAFADNGTRSLSIGANIAFLFTAF